MTQRGILQALLFVFLLLYALILTTQLYSLSESTELGT